ncbi:MAG: hypothetical protein PVJ21_18910 [Anaerolineales bacterium]|jgi:hypothetical protein
MSSDEEKQILKMVEEGKISAEEAMTLIKALEESSVEAEVEVIETEAGEGEVRNAGLEFEEIKARAQKFAMLPLWIGVTFTVLGAYWMYALVSHANYGFWFFCAWIPLLLGLLLVVLSAGGMHSRWLYLNVDQQSGEWPKHITFGLPLPLGIIDWVLRNFGHYMRGMDRANVEGILKALSTMDDLDEPLIVNVDEGENGDQVQVYIG